MKIVGGKWSNWSGSVVFRPRDVVSPQFDVDLAVAVRKREGPVRFPGNGHSFSPLNHTDGTLIDLSAFVGLKGFDPEREVATIAAATPLWGLGSLLHPLGYALAVMGDIDRQTLGGAVATGTHGTGRKFGSLSSQVASFRLLTATGEVLHCAPDENPEVFAAGRLGLGLFGVMTEIDLKVRPIYKLQRKYFFHPVQELFLQLDGLVEANRNFEFFWYPDSEVAVCRSLNESQAHAPARHSAKTLMTRGERRRPNEYLFAGGNELLRAMPGLTAPVHRLFSAMMARKQKVRWSHEVYSTPRTVKYHAMEYAVPYDCGAGAVQEIVAAIRARKLATGFPVSFRTVAADDIWISPFHGRASAAIGVYQYARCDPAPLFQPCEEILKAYGGRPHWGLHHILTREEAAARYPKSEDFCALRRKLDPDNRFLNGYLGRYFS